MVIGCKTASNVKTHHGDAAKPSARVAGKVISPDPVSGGAVTHFVPVVEGEVSTESWSSVVAGTTAGQRESAAQYCELRWKKNGFGLGPPALSSSRRSSAKGGSRAVEVRLWHSL